MGVVWVLNKKSTTVDTFSRKVVVCVAITRVVTADAVFRDVVSLGQARERLGDPDLRWVSVSPGSGVLVRRGEAFPVATVTYSGCCLSEFCSGC